MTNSRKTRRALFSSMIALILCCVMLVGTTFAWFTDSVSSAKNVITAGNLDVELYYHDGTGYENNQVTADTNLFSDELWEPGHVEVVKLKIANLGTLALKYQFKVNVVSETGSINVNNKTFKLSDHIKFAVLDEEFNGSRTEAVKAAEAEAVKLNGLKWTETGSMEPAVEGGVSEEYVTLVVWMPETVGNEANYKTGEAVPKIELGVSLYATQVEHEFDSFGNDYDAGLTHIPAWDGSVATGLTADEDGIYHITNGAELAYLNTLLTRIPHEDAEINVVLDSDINLNNQPWTPIGTGENYGEIFTGSFDGQGHTIYNVNVQSETDDAGLFGHAMSRTVIKNLTVENATVSGTERVAALIGKANDCDIINCHVVNVTVTGDSKVAALVGDLISADVKDCTVTNAVISGDERVSGLVGRTRVDGDDATVTNNTVKDSFIYGEGAAYFIGQNVNGADESTNVQENVILNGAAEVVAEGVVKTAEKAYEVVSKEGLLNLAEVLEPINIWNEIPINVSLMADIDMEGASWTPIGKMRVNFEGNNHTISNMNCVESDNKSGFFSYLGGSTISNLTLENVTSTGSQAGIFAGQAEGGKIVNCTIAGENIVTWDDASTDAITGNGVGAFVGVSVSYGTANTISGTIAEGATVTLNKGAMDPAWATEDQYYGGFFTADYETLEPVVNVTNYGEITVGKTVSTADELKTVINSGENAVITLADGEYRLSSSNTTANIKIVGTKNTVVDLTWGAYLDNATMTFEGVTIEGSTGYVTSDGVKYGSDWAAMYSPNITYNDCTFEGPFRIGRDGATFNDCTFELEGIDGYVWTNGADATFNGCTFNTSGKALLVYGGGTSSIVVSDCIFNDDDVLKEDDGETDLLKTAVEIGNDYNATYNVTITNATVNGFAENPKGIASNSTLWSNKNSMDKDHLNVVVDGVDVY